MSFFQSTKVIVTGEDWSLLSLQEPGTVFLTLYFLRNSRMGPISCSVTVLLAVRLDNDTHSSLWTKSSFECCEYSPRQGCPRLFEVKYVFLVTGDRMYLFGVQ